MILLLVLLSPVFGNAETSVVINEVAWMGTATSAADEWIELYNSGGEPVSLDDWVLASATDGKPRLTLSGIIPAYGFYLIERTDDDTVPGIPADFIAPFGSGTGAGLSNTNETLELMNAEGITVNSASWASDGPGDSSTKQTMEWTGSTWTNSLNPGGTPKAQNSALNQLPVEQPPVDQQPPNQPSANQPPSNQPSNSPPRANASVNKLEVAVNEAISFDASDSYDPEGDALSFNWNFGDGNVSKEKTASHIFDIAGTYSIVLNVSDGKLESYDYLSITITEPHYATSVFINEFIPNPTGSDEENEWIELVNESDADANISGWKLDDEETGSKEFTIPEETIISPSGFLVFTRTQTNLALNNDGDTVRLILPNGKVLQEVIYEKSKEGQSAARFGNDWSWQSTPTPGSKNLKETSQKTAGQISDEPSGSIISSTLSGPSNLEKTSEANNGEDNPPPKKESAFAAIGASSSSILPLLFKNGVLPAIAIALAGGGILLFLKRKLKSSL